MAICLAMITPAVASGATVKPDDSMGTATTKYYCQTYKLNPQNIFGGNVFVYKFRPIWRINTSNSISATTDGSTFTKSNVLSQWKLVDSASAWDIYKSGTRNVEAYYGEGISAGWGINVTGEASAKASSNGCDVTIKATANATIGQAISRKYKAVVSTGANWTSCNFSHKLYQ